MGPGRLNDQIVVPVHAHLVGIAYPLPLLLLRALRAEVGFPDGAFLFFFAAQSQLRTDFEKRPSFASLFTAKDALYLP